MNDAVMTNREANIEASEESRLEVAILASILAERKVLVRGMDAGFDASLFQTGAGKLVASQLSDMQTKACRQGRKTALVKAR